MTKKKENLNCICQVLKKFTYFFFIFVQSIKFLQVFFILNCISIQNLCMPIVIENKIYSNVCIYL